LIRKNFEAAKVGGAYTVTKFETIKPKNRSARASPPPPHKKVNVPVEFFVSREASMRPLSPRFWSALTEGGKAGWM